MNKSSSSVLIITISGMQSLVTWSWWSEERVPGLRMARTWGRRRGGRLMEKTWALPSSNNCQLCALRRFRGRTRPRPFAAGMPRAFMHAAKSIATAANQIKYTWWKDCNLENVQISEGLLDHGIMREDTAYRLVFFPRELVAWKTEEVSMLSFFFQRVDNSFVVIFY
jgi:hypothetical protein